MIFTIDKWRRVSVGRPWERGLASVEGFCDGLAGGLHDPREACELIPK